MADLRMAPSTPQTGQTATTTAYAASTSSLPSQTNGSPSNLTSSTSMAIPQGKTQFHVLCFVWDMHLERHG